MFLNLRPTRQEAIAKKHELIADIDAIICEDVCFKLLGREHILKPINVKNYHKFVNAYLDFVNMTRIITKESSDPKLDENINLAIDKIYDIICTCCDSITKDDFKKLEPVQIAALYSLIIQNVSGTLGEKKTL